MSTSVLTFAHRSLVLITPYCDGRNWRLITGRGALLPCLFHFKSRNCEVPYVPES